MDGQALHLQFVTWKATTDLVTPKSVQNTDLDTAWVCLSELNGNTSTFCKARSADFLYGKPRYLGVACTDDHRSYRGVLKNHPHPRRNACVGGRGDKYRCCWWLKFCIIWYGQDHVNSGTYHHPQSQIYVFFFFRRCFWYSIWNVPSLRQCALLWSAWAWWSGRRSLFLWVMNIILKSVRFTVSTDDLDFKRWKLTKHWPNVCVCSCNWAHFSKCFTWFLAGKKYWEG